ncbi:MAG: DUF4446 family protein [Candidatus Sungbacteria bacterium]|uniref:DUF4446 family protein n=1 Tax=Candidatus Sungiibacteriota bacterium TaxID=2750080 RepID=A0A9D6QU00_9BACT|nr:DUF4446 family protein [Candidatus Sungbacteria bacterium]
MSSNLTPAVSNGIEKTVIPATVSEACPPKFCSAKFWQVRIHPLPSHKAGREAAFDVQTKHMSPTIPQIEIALGTLILFFLAFGYFLYDTRKKLVRLFLNKVPESHEEFLSQIVRHVERHENNFNTLIPKIEALESLANRSFQKIGFIRFNPFADTGGDQSFSLAILDQENNGIIISSLYGREGTRVYAKAVDHGVPKQPISGEEEEVLARAMSK